MNSGYSKRFFTYEQIRAAFESMFRKTNQIKKTSRSKRIDKAFQERIMLAVTQVNGCRYCEYGHTRVALQAGVNPEEIKQLCSGEWHNLPEEQLPALLYAQHYAETAGKPSEESTNKIQSLYGLEKAKDISLYIEMITIGNLSGNTLDAFISRIQGKPAQNSSFWQEIKALAGFIILPPYLLVKTGLNGLFHGFSRKEKSTNEQRSQEV